MRESSRLSCSARATAVDVALHRNAIPVGIEQSLRIRIEERGLPPAIGRVGAQSGGFGRQREGLSPLLFRQAGRHRVIRDPEVA